MTRLLSGKLSELEATNGILQVNHTLQKKNPDDFFSVCSDLLIRNQWRLSTHTAALSIISSSHINLRNQLRPTEFSAANNALIYTEII